MLSQIKFFDVSLYTVNLLSIMLGVGLGATMWRWKAALLVAVYFGGLAAFYGMMYYFSTHPHPFS